MTGFAQFLTRNGVYASDALPLAHSTPALHLREIVRTGKIVASTCDVFLNEKLNYFFVGRPAYKHRADDGETPYWELPCCFIFEFTTIASPTRVFPFDSGAFSNGIFPSYLSAFDLSDFEVGSIANSAEKIIGAFFGNANAYFGLHPKEKTAFESEYSLDVFDAEVRALHRLTQESSSGKFDDRRLAIEIQSSEDVDLSINKPLAVVAPLVFFEDARFRDHVVNVWKATPISYPTYSLNVAAYYMAIYERVHEFYRQKKLLP